MNTLQNIKVKECCCGCTLRQGSLILLWMSLVYEAISILLFVCELLYTNRIHVHYHYTENSLTFLTFRTSYYLITSIAGLVLSIGGIYGIQKNDPKYLNLGLYYLGYCVAYCTMSLILLIFFPVAYAKLIMIMVRISSEDFYVETIFVFEVGYLFAIAALLYFWVTVRSCRDTMMKYGANGRADGEIPDPSALGYNPA